MTATDGVSPDVGVPRGPRQLHHELIQQIFAIGLSLRLATTLSTEPAVLLRLDQIGTELDATIQLVRVDAARLDR